MTFLQSLWRDLVDKRLWPVAVALLAAAVAIPFLIHSGPAPAPSTAAAPAAPVITPPATPAVSLALQESDKPRSRAGISRDPFKPLVFAKVAKSAAAAAPGSGSGSASGANSSAPPASGGGSSSASPTSPGPSSAVPSSPTPVAPVTHTTTSTTTRLFSYQMALQIGPHGKLVTHRGIRGVTYLPSSKNPLVTFIGFKNGGARAVFAVAGGVVVSGKDRVCIPSRKACSVLELAPGKHAILGQYHADGTPPVFYRLEIFSIRLKPQPRTAGASAARHGGGSPAGLSGLQPVVAVTRVTR